MEANWCSTALPCGSPTGGTSNSTTRLKPSVAEGRQRIRRAGAAASARTSGSASASARMIHHIIPVLLRDFRAGLAVKRHNLDGHCAHLVQVPVSQCLPTLFFREGPSPQLSDELHVMSVSAGILLVGKRAGCPPSPALALSQRRSKGRA